MINLNFKMIIKLLSLIFTISMLACIILLLTYYFSIIIYNNSDSKYSSFFCFRLILICDFSPSQHVRTSSTSINRVLDMSRSVPRLSDHHVDILANQLKDAQNFREFILVVPNSILNQSRAAALQCGFQHSPT